MTRTTTTKNPNKQFKTEHNNKGKKKPFTVIILKFCNQTTPPDEKYKRSSAKGIQFFPDELYMSYIQLAVIRRYFIYFGGLTCHVRKANLCNNRTPANVKN